MRNFADEICSENQNTHFTFNKFFSENRTVCEIMWKNCGRVGQTTDDNKIRHMRIACWITKAAHTQTHKHVCNAYCFARQIRYAKGPQYLFYAYIFLALFIW